MAKQLWLDNTQIWQYQEEATSGLGTGGFSQFTDWASVSVVTQAGTAADYFSVGDKFYVDLTDGTSAGFIVVAINHEGNNGLIMMGMQSAGTSQWATSDSTSTRRYNGSLLPSFCTNAGAKLPSELQAIVQTTTVKYNYTVSTGTVNGTGSTNSRSYKYWIPSICEIFASGTYDVRSVVGTQWEYFTDETRANELIFANYFRCRDTDTAYPARNQCAWNMGTGWGKTSISNTTSQDVVICFRI